MKILYFRSVVFVLLIRQCTSLAAGGNGAYQCTSRIVRCRGSRPGQLIHQQDGTYGAYSQSCVEPSCQVRTEITTLSFQLYRQKYYSAVSSHTGHHVCG
eukprot:3472791-Amphidinium_carterae.1